MLDFLRFPFIDPLWFLWALAQILLAVVIVKSQKWGSVGIIEDGETVTVKYFGGMFGINLPVPEYIVLWYLRNVESGPMFSLKVIAAQFFVTRLLLILPGLFLLALGSLKAYRSGKRLSFECVDERNVFGAVSGVCLHPFICGAFTLLALFGMCPLVIIPLVTGAPAGPIGYVYVFLSCFPLFLVAKLWHWRIHRLVDTVMVTTESIGGFLSTIYASIFALRLMPPNFSRMWRHKTGDW